MGELTALGVAAAGLASVILPFLVPRVGVLPFEAKDVERAAGPRRLRTILYAVILLLGMCGGIYVTFIKNEPDRYWFALLGGFIIVLMITIIVPEGQTKKVFLRLLEYWLVALAIAVVVFCLAGLWIAGSTLQAHMPRSRGDWVGPDEYPFLFWYSVTADSILLYVALLGLREYFTRVFERRASNNRLLSDASVSALKRASSSASKPGR